MLLIFVVTFIFMAFFWRLGSLTGGISPAESAARNSSSSLHTIVNNPVYEPHKILQFSLQKLFGRGALEIRLASSIFSIVFLFCFYQLVKGWFGKIIGFFATLIFAATPWFILLARSGTPDILLFAPVAVLASYYWLVKSRGRSAWLALLISSVLVMYLPGGLLLILLGAVFARGNLKQATVHLSSREKIISTIISLIVLAPLVYGGIQNPHVLKPLLLIPADWPSVVVAAKSIVWAVLSLLWRTPHHTDFIIGRLPVLNGAQITLALFGGFALIKLARSKLYLLLCMAAFGVLVAGINRDLALLSLALPAIALAVAAGLRYLYMQWRSVFPKNPLPKYLALSLIATLVAMHVFYGLHYSLIAWPNSSTTRSTYVLK